MTGTIDLLSDKVNRILKNGSNFADIDKNDFRNFMGIAQSSLKAMVESFEDLSEDEMKAFGLEISEQARNRSAMNIQIYKQFEERLSSKPLRAEQTVPFSSILAAAKRYMVVLDELDKNIDKLFENKVISLYNIKISNIAIVGVIKNACDLSDFAWFLFTGICYDIGMGLERPPKYRFTYMNSVKERMRNIVDDIYNGIGDGAIFNEILKIRRENKDMLLVDDNNEISNGMISTANINQSFGKSVISGLMSLNIFRWLGETWNTYRDSYYRSLEEKRDWMQTHIQLLRLKIQGLDKSDREFQKLQKIINNYDNMVAAADEKIKKYREED